MRVNISGINSTATKETSPEPSQPIIKGTVTPTAEVSILQKLSIHSTVEAIKNPAAVPKMIRSGARLTGKTFTRPSKEETLKAYDKENQQRKESLRNPVYLLPGPEWHDCPVAGGIVLIGACSGGLKTTSCATIISNYYHNYTKDVLLICNEETTESALNRIACYHLGYNFSQVHTGRADEKTVEKVEEFAKTLAQRVQVIGVDENNDTTCIEDVQAILEYAAGESSIGLVIIDYLQTIAFSNTRPDAESIKVSKLMGHYLKDYGRRSQVPVIVFAQLHPKRDDDITAFSERVQNDKTFYNHVFFAFEIVPDFEGGTATFKVHKHRYGDCVGREIVMQYSRGILSPMRRGRL